MWLEFGAGILAGGGHTLAGPDHLAAVAPLALRDPAEASRAGVRWGAGHALGVGLLAAAGGWLSASVEIARASEWAERAVGVVLVGIGVFALRNAARSRLHTHTHVHVHGRTHDHASGSRLHAHVHVHTGSDAHAPRERRLTPPVHRHGHAALGIGALHGIAGTAHLVAVLPALALPNAMAAAGYVAGYGAGAILAMGTFGWLVGRVGRSERFDGTRAYRALLSSTGLAAIAVGGFWLAS